MFKKFIILIFIAISIHASSFNLEKNSSIKQTIKILKNKYDRGDIEAGNKLGQLYYRLKDYNKSSKILLDLFLQGNFKSTPLLADQLARGLGEFDKNKNNCSKAVFMLFGSMKKEKNCLAYKILSEWYKDGVCLPNPNIKKSDKYLIKYHECIQQQKDQK